jgi:hypothetical protein
MLMFFTTGENADVIGSVLCSVGSDGAWHLHNHGMHTTRHDPISHQLPQNGCTTSPPLGHPIVQLSAIRKSKWDTDCASLLAARSSFMVQFMGVHREDTDTEFTTPIVTTFESQPSHVSWNLHMPWEAAVVLETGEVHLFDIQNSGSSSSKSSSLNLTAKRAYKPVKKVPPTTAFSATTHSDRKANLELINSEQSNSANLFSSAPALRWWECEFAWHPKTLLLAGTKEVSLVDFRITHVGRHAQVGSQQLAMGEMGGNCNTSIVATVPGTGNTPGYCKRTSQNDIFLSFARATYDGMYQFVTSTKQHLILFDTRRPQTPVLQWEHGMATQPPGQLLMCPLSELCPDLQQLDTSASGTGKAILAASLQSGDMHAFCYGCDPPTSLPLQGMTMRNFSDLDEKLYAWQLPSKISPPKATPNAWTDIFRSSMNFFQQENNRDESAMAASKGRVRENIAGLVVVPSDVPHVGNDHSGHKRDGEARRGFSMVQLTGVGDMLVQQLRASKQLPRSKSQVPDEHKRDANVPPESRKPPRRSFNLRKLPCALNCITMARPLHRDQESVQLQRV